MKDKELRKLLEKEGIIEIHCDNESLRPYYFGFQGSKLNQFKFEVADRQSYFDVELGRKANVAYVKTLEVQIKKLQGQLAAINKHYGITVEKPADEYVVTIDD